MPKFRPNPDWTIAYVVVPKDPTREYEGIRPGAAIMSLDDGLGPADGLVRLFHEGGERVLKGQDPMHIRLRLVAGRICTNQTCEPPPITIRRKDYRERFQIVGTFTLTPPECWRLQDQHALDVWAGFYQSPFAQAIDERHQLH